MTQNAASPGVGLGGPQRAPRALRADAQRNIGSLLEAAKSVFATTGVDAPAKQIADLAGVGVGTLYRHFPQRSDLVRAVFQRDVDACADAAPALAAANAPGAALSKWLHRYTEFVAAKRGLAAALHSGDAAYDALPGYFMQRLEPALAALLDAATASGAIRAGISARELLYAVATLCMPVPDGGPAYSQRMVALLVDGLRYGAGASQSGAGKSGPGWPIPPGAGQSATGLSTNFVDNPVANLSAACELDASAVRSRGCAQGNASQIRPAHQASCDRTSAWLSLVLENCGGGGRDGTLARSVHD